MLWPTIQYVKCMRLLLRMNGCCLWSDSPRQLTVLKYSVHYRFLSLKKKACCSVYERKKTFCQTCLIYRYNSAVVYNEISIIIARFPLWGQAQTIQNNPRPSPQSITVVIVHLGRYCSPNPVSNIRLPDSDTWSRQNFSTALNNQFLIGATVMLLSKAVWWKLKPRTKLLLHVLCFSAQQSFFDSVLV